MASRWAEGWLGVACAPGRGRYGSRSEQTHPSGRGGALVERHRMLTACVLGDSGNQAVRQLPTAERSQLGGASVQLSVGNASSLMPPKNMQPEPEYCSQPHLQ